ncbi:MAG: hypothetical protein JNM19_17315 [Chitinophagaceae bacterium]|nr:hypothetical protein [Chitinophagaceae bacterium]
MEYLLFVAYLVFFAWLVTKVKFFTRTGLSQPQLIILFLTKIMAGIFYGWIGTYYGGLAQMYDTWSYHGQSITEYHLLSSDPSEYFTNLFRDTYEGGIRNFLGTTDSYWNDLKGNFFIKVLSVFNILSFGHYYVNVIFYSFITLFGPVCIYRVMTDAIPGKKTAILLAAFLVPSFLYWTSGIHKEGLIFTGIGLITYAIYFGLKEKRLSFKKTISLISGLLLILTLRNFLIVLIIPAIMAWLLSARWPKRGLVIFASLYLLYSLLFFTARYISPKLDFPQAVVNKQKEFIQIKGSTSVPIQELEPSASSFLINTPQAITLSTIRPYPSDVKHILSLAAAIEINALLLIFLLFLFFQRNGVKSRNLIYFSLFFAFSVLLAIGFSVNNLGAIVRYRSVIIPLMVIPMVARIDWDRLYQLFLKNIKKNNNVNNSE